MNDDLPQYVDINGDIRRCGSLCKPDGFVSAFRTFEDEVPVWSDSQIRAALTDPRRRVARKVFGDKWIPNQGPFGSCNGFAAANAFSRARYLGGLQDGAQFSGSWIYSLINGGRDQGSMLEDGMRVAMEVGFVPSSDCPYDQIFPQQQKRGLREIAAANKAVDCYAVQTLQGLRTAGAAGYMLIVAVHLQIQAARKAGVR